ncbi:MAG TPA: hypothetical protein DD979_06255 [Gammaproteobacteria bacterium]|jgi:DedD protein|nr:hypothetical protein [Gammaproteobacteria bacterium]
MVSESPAGSVSDELHENQLKRRLLGAAVLIALAVIFLPLILDGSGTESRLTTLESIESEPPYDPAIFTEQEPATLSDFARNAFNREKPASPPIPQPQLDGAVLGKSQSTAEAGSPAVTSAPVVKPRPDYAESAPAPTARRPAAPPPEPAPAAVAAPQDWLIQVASFADKINALSLRSELREAGYSVDVKVGESAGKPVYRVTVGPITGKAEAQRAQAALDKTFKRKTLLLKQ